MLPLAAIGRENGKQYQMAVSNLSDEQLTLCIRRLLAKTHLKSPILRPCFCVWLSLIVWRLNRSSMSRLTTDSATRLKSWPDPFGNTISSSGTLASANVYTTNSYVYGNANPPPQTLGGYTVRAGDLIGW